MYQIKLMIFEIVLECNKNFFDQPQRTKKGQNIPGHIPSRMTEMCQNVQELFKSPNSVPEKFKCTKSGTTVGITELLGIWAFLDVFGYSRIPSGNLRYLRVFSGAIGYSPTFGVLRCFRIFLFLAESFCTFLYTLGCS